jgi:hypothetical protein
LRKGIILLFKFFSQTIREILTIIREKSAAGRSFFRDRVKSAARRGVLRGGKLIYNLHEKHLSRGKSA